VLPDWVEYLNFALGVVGTSGILILVRQWYIDYHSRKPYTFETFSGGWTAERFSGTGQLNFSIANRRSTPTTINILLGVPRGRGIQGLPRQRLLMDPIGSTSPRGDDFELPGKAKRRLLIEGLLPNAEYDGSLRVMVTDAEGGRYMLDYKLAQSLGEVPPALAGRPPVYGPRAAGDFGPP